MVCYTHSAREGDAISMVLATFGKLKPLELLGEGVVSSTIICLENGDFSCCFLLLLEKGDFSRSCLLLKEEIWELLFCFTVESSGP